MHIQPTLTGIDIHRHATNCRGQELPRATCLRLPGLKLGLDEHDQVPAWLQDIQHHVQHLDDYRDDVLGCSVS